MFPYLPAVALGTVLLIASARVVVLRRRGIWAVVVDPHRTASEMFFDSLAFVIFVFWAYLVFAYADGAGPAWLPGWLAADLLDLPLAQWTGAGLLAVAVLLYILALVAMGDSWRLGVDYRRGDAASQSSPAPLVTRGIFTRSRNPIYVSFITLALGVFFVHGTVVFLIAALVLAFILHIQIRREEKAMYQAHGQAFVEYCQRVNRYGPWNF